MVGSRALAAALVAALVALGPAQQPLPDATVSVDGKTVDVSPVLADDNFHYAPLGALAKAMAGAEVELKSGRYELSIGGRAVVRLPADSKSGKKADVLDPASGQVFRTVDFEAYPEKLEAGSSGPMVAVEALGPLLGVTVEARGSRLALSTPAYWALQVGVKEVGDRLSRNLAMQPDFGISPPASTLLFWIRPRAQAFVQLYALTDEGPVKLLGVDRVKREVDGLGPDDRARVRKGAPDLPVRVAMQHFGRDIGSTASYVAVVLPKDIEFDDPIAAINSGQITDYAVVGLQQRVTATPVLFDTVVVNEDVSQAAFAEKSAMTEDLLRALNGLRKGELLAKNTRLVVIRGFDPAALQAEQKAPYKMVGLYEAKPGDTVAKLAKLWEVSQGDILVANPSIAPGGQPEPGDLLRQVGPLPTPENPNPKPPPGDKQPRFIDANGFAFAANDTALRQSSAPDSAVLKSISKRAPLTIVATAPGTGVYKVAFGGTVGYVSAKDLQIRNVSQAPGADANGNAVAATALKYIGLPYDWGGNDLSRGIDCSHFVAQVYRQMGWPEPTAPVFNQEKIGPIVHFRPGMARRGGRTIYLPSSQFPQASTDPAVLRPGDRIIIQRGDSDAIGSRHTGIFIGTLPPAYRARFGNPRYAVCHASSSHGVTVSDLYARNLWKDYKFSVRGPERMARLDNLTYDQLLAHLPPSRGGTP